LNELKAYLILSPCLEFRSFKDAIVTGLQGSNISVNSTSPYFVQISLSSPDGHSFQTSEQVVDTCIWLTTFADDSPTRVFFSIIKN